jgi:glycerol transport system ATP-binding protein
VQPARCPVVTQVQDIGTYWLVTARARRLKRRCCAPAGAGQAIPAVGRQVWLQVLGEHTCYYRNEELIA